MTSGDTLFTIAPIDAAQTHPLRAMILLNGDLDASALAGDLAPTTLHVGVRDASGIVAVASLRGGARRRSCATGMAAARDGRPPCRARRASGACWCRFACGTRKRAGRALVVHGTRDRVPVL